MFTKEFMNRKYPQVNSMKDVRKLNNIYQIMWFYIFFQSYGLLIWIYSAKYLISREDNERQVFWGKYLSNYGQRKVIFGVFY